MTRAAVEEPNARRLARQCVLAVEASTAAGSLALVVRDDAASGWRVLATRDVPMGSGRDDLLTPAVDALLRESAPRTHVPSAHPPSAPTSSVYTSSAVPVTSVVLPAHVLTGVVCGAGPGSFTSLRIAAALAKGLAFALELPLYAVSSLAWVSDARGGAPSEGVYTVAMDALRGESYLQQLSVGAHGAVELQGAARRAESATLRAAPPASGGAMVVLDGATMLPVSAAGPWCPAAAAAARTASLWFEAGPVSVDAWEPAYGRLAEAQVQWEATHGRPLPAR